MEKIQSVIASASWIARNAALVLAAALVLSFTYSFMLMAIPLGPAEGPVMVEIKKGTSFRQTARLLSEHGLIRNINMFIFLGRATGLHENITPGRYLYEGSVSPWEVFRTLQDGGAIPWEVTVVEGDSLDQIKEKLLREGLVKEEDFDRLRADRDFMREMGIEAPSLEGYLFPDTYRISSGLSAEEILEIMINRLWEKYDDRLKQRTRELGFDEKRVLTLASIIEKEARVDGERALISAVYHNRLRKGIPLQADPTSVYGIKPMSEGVTREDIKRRTPYNTYRFRGLPPGPIASPGIKSIEAALYPADVPYLYFVANRDGTHTFSVTLREHQNAVNRYRAGRRG
jgi:UPF0755 protein